MNQFFCENGKEIAIAAIGAFLGFLFALILEQLKIEYDKCKSKKIIVNENNKKIEYFELLLEKVASVSSQQIEIVHQYVKEQKQNLLYPIPLKHIASNVFIRIKNIDNRGVFEALAERFKSDNNWLQKYNQLNSSLDYIEQSIIDEFPRINNITLQKAHSDLLYVKNIIEEIANSLSREAMNKVNILGDERWDDEEYILIDDTLEKYKQLIKKQADLEEFNVDFLELILREFANYEECSYVQDIIFKCKNARVRMSDIKNDIQHTIDQYQQIVSSLSKPIEGVQDIIKQLDRAKININKKNNHE